ncbi:heme ABC transporter ATP-binding protein [Neobacillus piezotolerans]|uniref:Heme ABC transporter ATP-binding protein n=1 Tax=Neobacillus piezotolerans TaxID=2259171 RepID=A0A3D8GJZ3_9BACI|nr:ABC transporter ATP-binding protein [Neobacillus piezotolerans]RDU34738.1 heme ABC transporter ATP-binding protein [Neobacillus piezotolerans]
MSDYIVEMKHITKRFPGIVANDDVSIGIKKGEIFALLGENGAGKSTLMSMLSGMYEPDEGEIFIRGEKVEISSPNHAAKLNIGMVHQHFKLVSDYTITENIILGVEPIKKLAGLFPYVDIRNANRKIEELSKNFGLEVDPTKKIDDLTVSMQQRVEILKVLYREAEILIFDEPTAVLTPQEIEFLLGIIEGLRKGGKTIVLITHKLEEIKKVADRCAVLNKGKLVDVLDVKETSTQQMARLMVGREVNFKSDKAPAVVKEEVLKVEHLTIKNEDGFEVVKDVSFTIHGGEIFAIAGVADNGQVEIADAIAGLTKVSGGKVSLQGKDITNERIRNRTEIGISYIPEDRQRFGLVLDFDLSTNLALKQYYQEPFCSKGILDKDEIDQFGSKLIDKYDIRSGQGIKTQVRSMSGGNQQKAIIAREIELQSPLMIFVQPTRGVDIGAIENIHNMMIQERDKGKAILLVSLELDEIMNVADTIGVIYNGQFQKIASSDSLTTNEVGEYMMGAKHE